MYFCKITYHKPTKMILKLSTLEQISNPSIGAVKDMD